MKDDWTPLECWCLYLNNVEGETLKQIAAKEPLIQRAITVEDVFVKNEEERGLYELREKSRLRLGNALHTAEHRGIQKGIEKGLQEGLQKGIQEEKQAVVRSMLARDMPLALISEISGLPVEEIEAMREARGSDNA
ncbi:MAG: Rpn family recombination-promoting nuclease/putative transposase [Synergistaceae bacterium]|jgi:predicted transposase/invertase (TIGR01784 family)|nr:Rpn family recombination-promoting nuclease/putative transposase [Synergistaceae bacterium]